MARPLKVVAPPIAYSIPDAAEAIGYGETVIKDAIAAKDLTRYYGTPTKPVVLHDDLVALVKSWPTERPTP